MNTSQHEHALLGKLCSQFRKQAPITKGAVKDLIIFHTHRRIFIDRHGLSHGMGNAIYQKIQNNNHLIHFTPNELRTVRRVLCENSVLSYHTLWNNPFDGDYDYPEFRDNRLQRVVTKRYEEIISNLEELQNMRTPWPFYLDTEGGYQNFPNGTNVALISIYNARDHEVLLLRVHELSRDEFGEVKRIINSMARRFVTFGNEDDVIVGPLANMQLEYGNDGRLRQPRTLRAHAEDIQFNLRKCETMSNWASAELREDQLQYAAMDSIVLHYLNIGAPLNWKFDLPRPIGELTRPPRYYMWNFHMF